MAAKNGGTSAKLPQERRRVEPLRGFEPRTLSLQVRCSTTELKRLMKIVYEKEGRSPLLVESYYDFFASPSNALSASTGTIQTVVLD